MRLLALLLVPLLLVGPLAGCISKEIEGGTGGQAVIVRNFGGERVRADVFVQVTQKDRIVPEDPGERATLVVDPNGGAMWNFEVASPVQAVKVTVGVRDGPSLEQPFAASLLRLCPYVFFDVKADGKLTYAGCGPFSQETGA